MIINNIYKFNYSILIKKKMPILWLVPSQNENEEKYEWSIAGN